MDPTQNSHEAILFFADGKISREMLYAEFEALLDCVVPMLDFRGRDVQSAYVRFDDRLNVSALVLFILNFDDAGYVDRDWNVPIQMLAERADSGPDLGNGPIRLAVRSNCPVAGQDEKMWDPAQETLTLIRERLAMNRLGIDISDSTRQQASARASQSAAPPGGSPFAPPQMEVSYGASAATAAVGMPQPGSMPQAAAMQQPMMNQAGMAPGAAADAMLAMMQQSNAQIAMLREQHQNELVAMQQRLTVAQQQIQALENEKHLLLQQLSNASDEGESTRREMLSRVDELQQEMDANLAASVEQARLQFEEDLRGRQAEFDRLVAEADEKVDNARRERQVAVDQMAALRGELTDLRRDKMRLLDDGADNFFDQLRSRNIKFVSFQPGAGHLTIGMDELSDFIDNTEKFVATKCGVTVEQYKLWLNHYNHAVCQGTGGNGQQCAKPLQRQLKPAEFVTGLHDRCDIHKRVPRSGAEPQRSSA